MSNLIHFRSAVVTNAVRLLVLCGICLAATPETPAENGSANSSLQQPTLVVQLGCQSAVNSIAFSRDGRFVLTADSSGPIVWEAATGRQIRRFAREKDDLSAFVSVDFSPEGRFIVEAGSGVNGYLRLLDATIGREIWKRKGWFESVLFAPDGNSVITKSQKHVSIWDAKTGSHRRGFELNVSALGCLATSPDGKVLVAGEKRSTDEATRDLFEPSNRRLRAFLLDATTGKQRAQFEHASDVLAVAVSADGTRVMTGSEDKTACLWDAVTGQRKWQFPHDRGVTSVAFSPDGKSVLTATAGQQAGKVFLWDLATGSRRTEFEVPPGMSALAVFSPDGKFILTASPKLPLPSSGLAALWNATTGELVRLFRGYSSIVEEVAVSGDGRYIVTGDGGGQAHLWEVTTGQEIQRFAGHTEGVRCIALSADNHWLLTGSWDGTARLWNAQTGQTVQRFDHPTSFVTSVAFSRDGKRVATASWDETVCVWDATTGTKLVTFEHEQGVDAVAFSPDGKYLLTAFVDSELYGFYDKIPVTLWEIESKRKVWTGNGLRPIQTIQFSPDGRFALTSGFDGAETLTQLWDVLGGEEVYTFYGESVLFLPDGKLVVVEYEKPAARQPQTIKGLSVRCLTHPDADYRIVAVSPDARFGLAVGIDGATSVRDLESGQELVRLVSFVEGDWAVVNPQGRFDTNTLEEVRGLHWIIADEPLQPLPMEIFMRDYYEPGLLTGAIDERSFDPVRELARLNRLQPAVKIAEVTRPENSNDSVTVCVEVSTVKSQTQRDDRGEPIESGAYDLRLFRDGQLVAQFPPPAASEDELTDWRRSTRIGLDRSGRRIVEFSGVALPRRPGIKQVEFSAYAFNEDRVKSATARRLVRLDPSFDALSQHLDPLEIARRSLRLDTSARRRAYLITVGVSGYDNAAWNLRYASRDAELFRKAMASALAASGEFNEVIPVTLASDYPSANAAESSSATRANIKELLELLSGAKAAPEHTRTVENAARLTRATPDDLVLMFISSHGVYRNVAGRDRFYFLPSDIGEGRTRDVTPKLLARGISSDELALWLREVDAGEIVLIANACQSEASVKTEGFKPGPMGDRGLGQLAYDKRMRILAASETLSSALEADELSQSLLTRALVIEGLQARQADYQPKDQTITLSEWLNYCKQRVPMICEELGYPPSRIQRPVLFDFVRGRADLTLVKPAAPAAREEAASEPRLPP